MAGYIPRWFTRPQTVTQPGTNRVWRRATTLIEANALPLSQTDVNCFRKIFYCCWKESVKRLQYFCLIDQRQLFWQKMITSDNIILVTLSRLITSRFVAIGSLYSITTWSTTPNVIKLAIWNSFAESITLHWWLVTCLWHCFIVFIVF